MTVKKRSTKAVWSDPDDAPELTAEFFNSADLFEGSKLKARGRLDFVPGVSKDKGDSHTIDNDDMAAFHGRTPDGGFGNRRLYRRGRRTGRRPRLSRCT